MSVIDELLAAPACRTSPSVVALIPFEHAPVLVVLANTTEDEQRARAWVTTSRDVHRLLEGLLAGDDVPRRLRPVTRSRTP